MPDGWAIERHSAATRSSVVPRSARVVGPCLLSRMRSTTFSPSTLGAAATRTSRSVPATPMRSCPSGGRRRSAMSRPAITLMRPATAGATAAGRPATSHGTPSMRSRTHSRSRRTCRCTAEARSRIVWVRIRSTSWMTGACSPASASRPAAAPACSSMCPTARYPVAFASRRSDTGTTTSCTGAEVIASRRLRSAGEGSAVATTSRPRSNGSGHTASDRTTDSGTAVSTGRRG